MLKSSWRKSYLKNEYGNSLVFTLLVLVLITTLGLSLLTVTSNTLKISTNERTDQAVYYIAEAGLAERRAYIYSQVKNIYNNLKTQYDQLSDPQDKYDFKFDEKFYEQINNISLAAKTLNSDHNDFKTHFNEKAESITTIERIQNGSSIAFTITSEGKIGDTQSRTISQNINISLDNVKNTENVSTGNDNTPSKLNACFALFAYGDIDVGGGSFEGDIYSEEKINITGSPKINGNILSKEDINITGSLELSKGLYSEKNITVPGSAKIGGNISANGNLTIPNATIDGDVLIGGNVQSGATIKGNIKADGTITINNGEIRKDVFSNENILLNGGTLLGDVISKQNITVSGYPGFSDRGLHAIAKNNIHIKGWITPKKTIYSGELKFDEGVSYPSSSVSESEVNSIIQNYEQKIIDSIKVNANFQNSNLADLTKHVTIQNDCISNLPELENVDTVFAPAPPIPPATSTISIPSLYTGEYIVKSAEDTHIDEIALFPDSNYRINQLTISLTKPNGTLDVSKATLESNSTLTLKLSANNNVYINDFTMNYGSNLIIDLNGGDHSLYVDSLTSAGNIKLVNTGSLKIFVKNKLNLTGSTINKDGEVSNLSIYYEGKESFNLGDSSKINSNLHVKDANVTITGGAHLYGDLFVYGKNEIKIEGGTSVANQLILAPHSTFTIQNGPEINGNVIVDKFTSSGGFKITKPTLADDDNENKVENGGNSTTIPVSDYGDADSLFTQEPQLEIDN